MLGRRCFEGTDSELELLLSSLELDSEEDDFDGCCLVAFCFSAVLVLICDFDLSSSSTGGAYFSAALASLFLMKRDSGSDTT